MKVEPWYVNFIGAYGHNRYDTARDISFGPLTRRAAAGYRGHTVGGHVESGYRIITRAVDIIPMASITGIRLTRGSFQETNAGALNLHADRERTSSLAGSLGVRLGKEFNFKSGALVSEVRATWDHESQSDHFALNARFADAPLSSFTVTSQRPDRNSIGLGLGLAWRTNNNLHISLTYDGGFSGNNTRHGGTLGLSYRW